MLDMITLQTHTLSHRMYRALRQGVNPVRAMAQYLSHRCQNTVAAEPFLNGSSASYVEEMYEQWTKEPTSVHKVWH